MDDQFDQYGDSYLEKATVESLHCAMNRVELDVCIYFQKVLFHEVFC